MLAKLVKRISICKEQAKLEFHATHADRPLFSLISLGNCGPTSTSSSSFSTTCSLTGAGITSFPFDCLSWPFSTHWSSSVFSLRRLFRLSRSSSSESCLLSLSLSFPRSFSLSFSRLLRRRLRSSSESVESESEYLERFDRFDFDLREDLDFDFLRSASISLVAISDSILMCKNELRRKKKQTLHHDAVPSEMQARLRMYCHCALAFVCGNGLNKPDGVLYSQP